VVIDSQLRQLEAVDQELSKLDESLAALAHNEPRVALLMTLPGVNYVVAIGLLAALGDISRFVDGDHAAAYLGLAPSTRQSGDRCYHGHITKRGRSQARWRLTQSAKHAARHPGPIGQHRQRARRRSRGLAVDSPEVRRVRIIGEHPSSSRRRWAWT
jgi:transposase